MMRMASVRAAVWWVAVGGAGASAPGQVCTGWLAGEGIPGLAGAVNAGGNVSKMTLWDPDGAGPAPAVVVAGGAFVQAGAAAAANIAVWDGRAWSTLGSGVNGPVFALAAAPDGSLLAAGDFTIAGGGDAFRIARWDGLHWSALGRGLEQGAVYAVLALPDGRVVAGGAFRRAGGGAADRVAMWADGQWHPMGPGMSDMVFALAVDSTGAVVAGGAFTASGAAPARRLARWGGSAWAEAETGVNGIVYALESMPSGDIVVGGDFSASNSGTSMARVGLLGPAGWRAMGAGVGGAVSCLRSLGGGRVLVGGGFSSAGGQPASCAAVWDGQGWSRLPGAFTPPQGGTASVTAAAPIDGGVMLSGRFEGVEGLRLKNAARWSDVWRPAGSGLDTYTRCVVRMPDGEYIFGGPFTVADGQPAGGIAAWNGARWRSFPGPGPAVTALTLLGDRLVAGGTFRSNGLNRVAAWDGSSWSAIGGGMDDHVYALATTSSGHLIAGGLFTRAGVVPARSIARWDGQAWTPLGEGLDGPVTSILELPGGDLAVGGYFTHSGATVLNGIGRWDGASWRPFGGGFGGLPGYVRAEALALMPNGDLVAGGWITTADGLAVGNIARWDGDSWNSMGAGLNATVERLVVLPDGDLVAAGWFSTAGARSAGRVARWDGQEWWPVVSGGGVGAGVVYGLTLLEDSSLVISGTFASVQSRPDISMWGRWTLTGVPWVVEHPDDATLAEGDDLVLHATAPSGYCGLAVQWRRDGEAVLDGPGGASPGGGLVSGASTVLGCPTGGDPATLTIRGARAADSGSYAAEFLGPCGATLSTAAVVRVSPRCPADFNGDGFLDFFDYLDFVSCFEGQGCSSPDPLAADFNGDGFVDFFDYGDFVDAFGAGC